MIDPIQLAFLSAGAAGATAVAAAGVLRWIRWMVEAGTDTHRIIERSTS